MRQRWYSMKSRCFNENSDDYQSYGAKGISVSKDWMIFQNFYHDMQSTFSKELVLDRIDPYKGYSKENCQWISKIENSSRERRKSTPRTMREKDMKKSTVWLYPHNIAKVKKIAERKKLSASKIIRDLIDSAR